ncbi:STR6L-like protein, partial [Mya arenaria]
ESVDLAGASIAMELPIVLFSLLVVIKFVWKLAKCLKQKKYSRSRSEEVGKKLCRKSDLLHVKALFHPRRCTEAEKAEKTMPCCTSWFRKFVKPFPGFKFPIGMLITTFVSCIFIYWTTILLATAANMFACLITVLCGLRNVHLVLMNYKRDMLCLYKGDKSFIPAVLRNCSPNIYMVCVPCYQVGQVQEVFVMSLWSSPEPFTTQTPKTTTPVDRDYAYCNKTVFNNDIVSSYSHWFLIPSESVDLAGASIALELPVVLFSLLVVVKFVGKLTKCLRQKKYSRSRSEEVGNKLCTSSDLLYVKTLFNATGYTETEEDLKTMPCWTRLFRKFVKPVHGFKFPIAILITTFLSCIFIYWTTINLVTAFDFISHKYGLLTVAKAQGMRFIGNSIVGSFWGSVFVYVVVYVPVALMLLTLKYLDDKDKLHLLWPRFEWLIYPACTILIFKIQTILVAKFFMQPKLEEIDKYKPLAVNNRTVYDVFSFFMLFLNASIGLVQYVKRILFSAVLGVFLIPRMDRSLYMRGYETMDKYVLIYFIP